MNTSLYNIEYVQLPGCFGLVTGLSYMRLKRLKTVWLDECKITLGAALNLSSTSCPDLSYISMRNLLPVLENDDDEHLFANILDML